MLLSEGQRIHCDHFNTTFINSCAPPSGPRLYCDSIMLSVMTARASLFSRKISFLTAPSTVKSMFVLQCSSTQWTLPAHMMHVNRLKKKKKKSHGATNNSFLFSPTICSADIECKSLLWTHFKGGSFPAEHVQSSLVSTDRCSGKLRNITESEVRPHH